MMSARIGSKSSKGSAALKEFHMSEEVFLDQTIIIYGRRRSGKSTIVEDIMYTMRHKVPNIFFISQTAQSSNSYRGIVPDRCIKGDVDKKWLETLLEVQKMRTQLYRVVNCLDSLHSLFMRIKTIDTQTALDKIKRRACALLAENDVANHDNADKRKKVAQGIEQTMNNWLINFYKSCIKRHRAALVARSSIKDKPLSRKEQLALEYFDFNPRILLVFDDCAASFKKWSSECSAIREIFYNGRWLYFTIIVSTQTDKCVLPELRSNSLINIFTTREAADTNFTRASNKFPKDVVRRAEQAAYDIFEMRSSESNFRKMVFLPEELSENVFQYLVATPRSNFRMCPNSILWKLAKDKDAEEDIDALINMFT
jgi:hypothetical protein